MNLDQLDDWLKARVGTVAAGLVEGWLFALGVFLIGRVLGAF